MTLNCFLALSTHKRTAARHLLLISTIPADLILPLRRLLLPQNLPTVLLNALAHPLLGLEYWCAAGSRRAPSSTASSAAILLLGSCAAVAAAFLPEEELVLEFAEAVGFYLVEDLIGS